MSEWPTVQLRQLIEPGKGVSYGIVQPGSPVRGGIPIVRVSDVRDGQIATAAPLCVQLWLILGDGVNQAADLASGATSIPSRNLTPWMTFGNWF
jgi:hypothetical protein